MLYLQKGNFQKVVRSIGGNWMSATQATFLGIIFIFLTAASFYLGLTYENWRWILLLVPMFLFLRLAMNTLDGMLSREYGTATAAGELWNEALDVFGDTVCYGSLLLVTAVPYKPLVLFICFLLGAVF